MKSLFRLSIFSILFIGLLPISCNIGGCPDPMGYIVEPTVLSIRVLNKFGSENSDTLHFTSGSASTLFFRIYCGGNSKYVTENLMPSLLLGQTLSASKKCNLDYFIEFKPALKSLTFRCNKDVFSHLANSSLNDELKVIVEGYTASKNDTFSMAQYNDSLLYVDTFVRNSMYYDSNLRFIFKKDVPKGIYQFRFEMKLEDGASMEGLSPWISID